MMERLKDFAAPTRKTKFIDFEGKVVSCRVIDDEIKSVGVCWSGEKTAKVRDIRDALEIGPKFGLIPPIERRNSRDYGRIKSGAKAVISVVGLVVPPLHVIKPLSNIL